MGRNTRSVVTIWAPLTEIRINARTTRSLSAATVERTASGSSRVARRRQ